MVLVDDSSWENTITFILELTIGSHFDPKGKSFGCTIISQMVSKL